MQTMIGVDVGGTLLRAAALDLNLIERVEQPPHAGRGPSVVLDRLYETIRQVLPERPADLLGIGIVLPGPLDVHEGILIAPPNLPLRDAPIVALVEENVGGPVFIGNDADLAGLAAAGGFRSIPIMEDVDLVRRLGRARLVALEAAFVTSAARWRAQGWWRRSARNLSCLALWFLGVPPARIARLYAGRRRAPD